MTFTNPHDCDRCATLERTCDLHQEVDRIRANKSAASRITTARVDGDHVKEHDCGCVFIESVATDPDAPPFRVKVCRDHYIWIQPEAVAVGGGDPDCHFCRRWGKPCSRHGGAKPAFMSGGQGKSFPKCPDCDKRVFGNRRHPCAASGVTKFVVSASVDEIVFGPMPDALNEPAKEVFEDLSTEPENYSLEAAVDVGGELEEVSLISVPTSSCGYCRKRGALCVRHGGERSGVYTAKKSRTLEALTKEPAPPPIAALEEQHEVAVAPAEPEPTEEPDPEPQSAKQPENAPDDSAAHTVTIKLKGIKLGSMAEIAKWTAEHRGTIDVRPE